MITNFKYKNLICFFLCLVFLMNLFISSFAGTKDEADRQVVAFQLDKLTQIPTPTFSSLEAQYFYELGMKHFCKQEFEFVLTEENMIAIFHKREIPVYDLYRMIYAINQTISSSYYDYGYSQNPLFVLDFAASDPTLVSRPKLHINPEYHLTVSNNNIEMVKDILTEAKITTGMDQEKAVLRINNYITNNFTYSMNETYNKTNIYNVLESKRGLCHDYANAFRFLTRMCGIESYYISGYTDEGLHAWNKTIINGTEKYTDPTWNQTECLWLLKSPDKFQDHVATNIY